MYTTRMLCEEDSIFDPDEINYIVSKLCNTQCNDPVAIIISRVQYNNKNPSTFCKLIVCLLNTHVYGTMFSTQIVFPVIILATHAVVS